MATTALTMKRAMAGRKGDRLEYGWLHCDYRTATARRHQRRETIRLVRYAAKFAIEEALAELHDTPGKPERRRPAANTTTRGLDPRRGSYEWYSRTESFTAYGAARIAVFGRYWW